MRDFSIKKRYVALKEIHKRFLTDNNFKQRFLREAQYANKLKHASIVEIYELNLDCDTPYMAIEFVEGKSLREILQEKGIDNWVGNYDFKTRKTESAIKKMKDMVNNQEGNFFVIIFPRIIEHDSQDLHHSQDQSFLVAKMCVSYVE